MRWERRGARKRMRPFKKDSQKETWDIVERV